MPPAGDDRDADDPPSAGDNGDSSRDSDEFVFGRSPRPGGTDADGREENGADGRDDPPDSGSESQDGDGVDDRSTGPGGGSPRRSENHAEAGDGAVPRERNPPIKDPSGVEGGGHPADPDGEDGPLGWFLGSDRAGVTFVREFAGSVLVVVMIGLLLFAISGVWPPMVAVKSGSMEPHMYRGDLVFVMEEHRLPPKAAVDGTGVATHSSSLDTGYRRFGDYGDVIVYRKDGRSDATPIIHRTRFWVSEGENWFDRANRSFVNGNSCEAIPNCPAPHAGFITKGDRNEQYDQISGISGPVKPAWIKGTAEVRIPWLGHVRLELSELRTASIEVPPLVNPTTTSAVPARG